MSKTEQLRGKAEILGVPKPTRGRLLVAYVTALVRLPFAGGGRQTQAVLFPRLFAAFLGRLAGFAEVLLLVRGRLSRAAFKAVVAPTLAVESGLGVGVLFGLLVILPVTWPLTPTRAAVWHLLVSTPLLHRSGFCQPLFGRLPPRVSVWVFRLPRIGRTKPPPLAGDKPVTAVLLPLVGL